MACGRGIVLRMGISARARSIPPSAVFELVNRVAELRRQGAPIVALGAGEPDFPGPPEASAAAAASAADGRVGYTATAGLTELRTAAAAHVSRICGVTYSYEQLVVTNGAKEALVLALAALCDPGDEVLVPQPAWLSYGPMAQTFDIRPVELPGDIERGFRLSPSALAAAIGKRTRVLVLNSPCNPTGLVYSRRELAALAEVIVAHDLWVVSDEIYWPFVFEGSFCSPAALPGMAERTVVVNGLSKSYSMTGWRIGFLAAPEPVAAACNSLKSHVSSNTAAPSQHAALGALGSGDGFITRMREAFARRRRLALDAVATMPDVQLEPPAGAFYVFPRVDAYYRGAIEGSQALCRALLEEAHLAVVPGAVFGEDRCIRISIAAADEQVAEGLRRLGKFLAGLRGKVGSWR